MYYIGEVVRFKDKDHVVLKIDYKQKKVLIGIPNKYNISEEKKWVELADIK